MITFKQYCEKALGYPWPRNAVSDAWEHIEPGEKFWLDPNGKLYWTGSSGHGVAAMTLFPGKKGSEFDQIESSFKKMIVGAGWVRINIEGKTVWADGDPNSAQRKTLKDMAIFTGGYVEKDYEPFEEAFLNPDEKTPFKKRLGRCYELAGRFAMHNPGTALVHGSIEGFGNPRINHAWVELGGKKIWEPASGKEWDSEIFAQVFKPKARNWYETKELYAKAGTEGTWGPWDD